MASSKKNSYIEQRSYVKIRTLLGKSAHDIHVDLVQVYSMKGALSYPGVRRWAQRFRVGRESVEDDPRAGAPVTAVVPKYSSAVKELVDSDPHITVKELAHIIGISTGSVDHILKSKLNLSKVCARWVPHCLTKAQMATRVRCCRNLLKLYKGADPRRLFEVVTGDETWVLYSTPLSKEANKVWKESHSDPPMIPRPDFRSSKVMYCIFFDGYGPVAQIIVPKGQTITGNFYTSQCLREFEQILFKRRPSTGAKGLKLLHDNARPHKTKQVKAKIASMGMVELEHPPYSPDLAPCDFYLFPKLKEYLSGRHFDTNAALGSAIFQYLNLIPPEDYKKVFEQWLERLQRCINNRGEYFEKIKH